MSEEENYQTTDEEWDAHIMQQNDAMIKKANWDHAVKVFAAQHILAAMR